MTVRMYDKDFFSVRLFASKKGSEFRVFIFPAYCFSPIFEEKSQLALSQITICFP
jgi:hypothetical protein